MKRIINILFFIRFINLIIASFTILICAHSLESFNYSKLILCIIIVVFSMIIGNVMNDVLDIQTDTVNRPKRLLINNSITLLEARVILFISSIVLLFCLIQISYSALLFYVLVFCLMLLYNIFLKNTPLIGNIIVSFLLSSVVIFTEILLFGRFVELFFPAILAFGISIIREIIKDLEDYKGDKKSGRHTLPIIIGQKKTIFFVIGLIVLFSSICFLPAYYNLNYLLYIIILIEIPLIYSLFLLINQPTKKEFTFISLILKGVIIGGLLIVFLIKQ